MVDEQDFTSTGDNTFGARSDKPCIIVCGSGDIGYVHAKLVEANADMSNFVILVDQNTTVGTFEHEKYQMIY